MGFYQCSVSLIYNRRSVSGVTISGVGKLLWYWSSIRHSHRSCISVSAFDLFHLIPCSTLILWICAIACTPKLHDTAGQMERHRDIQLLPSITWSYLFSSQACLHKLESMVFGTVTVAFSHYLEENYRSVQWLMSHCSCRQNWADQTKHNPETTEVLFNLPWECYQDNRRKSSLTKLCSNFKKLFIWNSINLKNKLLKIYEVKNHTWFLPL